MSICSSLLNSTVLLSCALQGVEPPTPSTQSEPVQFVVIGDMPYSQQEAKILRTDIKDAIAAANVPFVIHYGDFKAGNESCTDEVFKQAQTEMERLHSTVIFTPGDNDWTDCDRSGLLQPKSELERLDTLRQQFFTPSNDSITRQSNYPENARWWEGELLLTTLHVVGTDNGRTQILQDDPQTTIARVDARDQANQTWLAETFAIAKAKNAQGLVLVLQADLSQTSGQPCLPGQGKDCDAYATLRTQLQTEAANWTQDGQQQKPVLLIHGDTFPYCWDKRFGGDTAPNLWRLNAWGDFQQPADATRITFHPNHPEEPFTAQTLMNQTRPNQCSPKS